MFFCTRFHSHFLSQIYFHGYKMRFIDNFRIAYFFLLICIYFTYFCQCDFICLPFHLPESLARNYIKCQFYYCSINNTNKKDNVTHFWQKGKNSGTQQCISTVEQEIWLEWFPLSSTKFHLSFKCFNSQEEQCKYA